MSSKKLFFSAELKDFPPPSLLMPGRKAVAEIIASRPSQVDSVLISKKQSVSMQRLVDSCRQAGLKISFVPPEALDRLYPGAHQGVIARLFPSGFTPYDNLLRQGREAVLPLILAFDQIKDSGNFGVLARTGLALGVAGLVLPNHNSACLGPMAAKASAGALASIPVAKVVNLSRALDQAREAGYLVYGTDTGGENLFLTQLRLPAVIVLGSEKSGIRPGIAKRCDHILSIPMPGAMESLNLAQAGAIVIGQFAGQAARSINAQPSSSS